MKLSTRLPSIFDRFVDSLVVLAIVLMAFAWLAICYDVFVRFFFNRSIIWLIEVIEYILLSVCFLGAAWLLRREGHITVDVVVNRLNPRAQALLNIVTSILGIITFLIITWYGMEVVWGHFQTGLRLETTLGPPKYAVMAVIPLGSFLLIIQLIRRTYGYLRGWSMLSGKNQEAKEKPSFTLEA